MKKTRKNVGAQIYGYIVCIIAVITFLISVSTLVNAILDLGDPIHAGWTNPNAPSLASYENYKMDILKSTQTSDAATTVAYIPDDATIKVMYESARNDKIRSVQHNSNKSIIVSSLLILISVILFITHWRWMQKLSLQA